VTSEAERDAVWSLADRVGMSAAQVAAVVGLPVEAVEGVLAGERPGWLAEPRRPRGVKRRPRRGRVSESVPGEGDAGAAAEVPVSVAEVAGGGWPPAEVPGQVWVERPVAGGGGLRRVRLREVRLWGELVLVDGSGAVWCDGCLGLVPVEVLGRAGHGHRVGLRLRRDVFPLGDEGDGPGGEPWPA